MNHKKWIDKPIPPFSEINKVEMLVGKDNPMLLGIRMYSSAGTVIFTTGNYIEKNEHRNDNWGILQSFELYDGERIIGVKSHNYDLGFS